ncbi:MAG: type IV pilus modification PilV family protein, partial [Gemmatimonadota bacterium]
MSTRSRDGFTLVELVIALVILAVGVLALAGSSGYVTSQVRIADLRSERAAARNQRLRALQKPCA